MPAYQGQSGTFVEEWKEIDRALHRNPHLSSERLMLELQKLYPGRFRDGQIRTLRRRVSKWRLAHPEYAKVTIPGASLPRGSCAVRAAGENPADYIELPAPDTTTKVSKLCENVGFANVWDDIIFALKRDPYLSAQALFSGLQQVYPGRFRASQLATFSARLKDWRRMRPEYAKPLRGAPG